MTTVAQLIAILQTQPQDAIVRVLKEGYCGYEHYCKYEPLESDDVLSFDKEEKTFVDLGE